MFNCSFAFVIVSKILKCKTLSGTLVFNKGEGASGSHLQVLCKLMEIGVKIGERYPAQQTAGQDIYT